MYRYAFNGTAAAFTVLAGVSVIFVYRFTRPIKASELHSSKDVTEADLEESRVDADIEESRVDAEERGDEEHETEIGTSNEGFNDMSM